MAKFKVRLKLEKLEFEVEGDRAEAPQIARHLGDQLAGLLSPADLADKNLSDKRDEFTPNVIEATIARKKRGGKKPSSSVLASEVPAIDWKHDPDKWGVPKQEWNTAQKSIWLLHVVKAATGSGELSANDIMRTFNKHFKQSGAIKPFNVTRDLGKEKIKSKPLVQEDTSKSPSLWYLTLAGIDSANKLIEGSKIMAASA